MRLMAAGGMDWSDWMDDASSSTLELGGARRIMLGQTFWEVSANWKLIGFTDPMAGK